jgi:hypothetical protein
MRAADTAMRVADTELRTQGELAFVSEHLNPGRARLHSLRKNGVAFRVTSITKRSMHGGIGRVPHPRRTVSSRGWVGSLEYVCSGAEGGIKHGLSDPLAKATEGHDFSRAKREHHRQPIPSGGVASDEGHTASAMPPQNAQTPRATARGRVPHPCAALSRMGGKEGSAPPTRDTLLPSGCAEYPSASVPQPRRVELDPHRVIRRSHRDRLTPGPSSI